MTVAQGGGASAPGKLMICGEYVVLDGAEAVVAAVSTRAYARWSAAPTDRSPTTLGSSPDSRGAPPEAVVARRWAEASTRPDARTLVIDVSELRQGHKKVGLGSSAAAAAAAAGAVFDAAGLDLRDRAVRGRVLDAALGGHREVAPQGSGADVAAAVLGGFVRFRRLDDAVEAFPLLWPTAVEVTAVWTGSEARTSDFVAAVKRFASASPAGYREHARELGTESEQLASAAIDNDSKSLIEAAGNFGRAMGRLGEAAGVPIVTPGLALVSDLASRAGGSAKPSGAGGGDVAVAFFDDPARRIAFETACRERGLVVLSLALGAEGVRPEAPQGND